MASVGDWTRPTERMFLPPRRAARLMNRVREAPQIRSITCRASPAAASAKSSSAVEPNAVLISWGVIAENRARATGTSGRAERTRS